MRTKWKKMLGLGLCVGLVAGGCGGGGGGEDNTPPIAEAGENQTVQIQTLVTLDGSGSTDADGDTLTYSWELSAPSGSSSSLSDSTDVSPTFTPDLVGSYTISLVVSDGEDSSAADQVVITANDSDNTPPVAEAGEDQEVEVGIEVTLDGSASTDEDEDTLSFAWTLTRPVDSAAELQDSDTATPSLTPDVPGDYVVQLIVNDGTEDSAPDDVVISVTQDGNHRPVAILGDDQAGIVGDEITIDGSASLDADAEDTLTYNWTLTVPEGSATELVEADTATPSFTPDVAGEFEIELVVSDGTLASEPDALIIAVTEAEED